MNIGKVLVTGGSGFIGRSLCKHLLEKGLCVTEKDTTNRLLDITNLDQLLSIDNQVQGIIHLAGKTSIMDSFTRPHETYRTNVLGTLNMLEFARVRSIPNFIFISTYVYGQPCYLPIDEKHPVNPHSPYNHSKLIGEQLCRSYSNNFRINIVTIRPFYIYGPGSKPLTFVPSVIQQIGKVGKVLLSNLNTRRDFLFVEDFIHLIEKILIKFPEGYNLYNVGSGRSYTLEELTFFLFELLSKKAIIEYDSKMRPNDIHDMVADISKVSKAFNWMPSTNLKKGLLMCVKNSRY
jgi:nucleoside-diphosphate-sugar epimerase